MTEITQNRICIQNVIGRHWADMNNCSYNEVTKAMPVWIWLLKCNYNRELKLYYITFQQGIKKEVKSTFQDIQNNIFIVEIFL